TVFELDAGSVDLDGQFAIPAIAQGIPAVKSDGVVGRSVALDLRKGRSKIIGVEERLAARVGAERGHHLLRGEAGVHVVGDCAAVVSAGAAQAAGGGVA